MAVKTIAETLVDKMQNDTVLFAYRKKSGEVRPAIGTLNKNEIPADKQLAQTPGGLNGDKIFYFDVQKESWRTCKASSIIKVEK